MTTPNWFIIGSALCMLAGSVYNLKTGATTPAVLAWLFLGLANIFFAFLK